MQTRSSLAKTMIKLFDALPLESGPATIIQNGVVYLGESSPGNEDEQVAILYVRGTYFVAILNNDEYWSPYKLNIKTKKMYPISKEVDDAYKLSFWSTVKKHLPVKDGCDLKIDPHAKIV